MSGDKGYDESSEDLDDEIESESDDDIVTDTDEDDNVGDMSVEINVDELVAKIESSDSNDAARKRDVRKRLDEMQEQQGEELDSTYNINLDDNL